jgi:hypothetical protein
VTITKRSPSAGGGDIFLAAQQGPLRDGPTILDPHGGLVWFKPVPARDWATNFRVQQLGGAPVLTWWQGYIGAGVGVGEDVIADSSYRQLTVIRAANGLSADLHEFVLSPQGTALITAYFPVIWDASSVHGSKRQVVMDSVVQEIDIPTGLVLYQWDSLDHVPLTDSYVRPLSDPRFAYDYFHVNSVDVDADGNLVISGRNSWTAYKVDRRTGAVLWRLGGRHSSFRMSAGAGFAFQHDVRVRAADDLLVTLFDNGAGPPTVHRHSRGLELALDPTNMTATVVARLDHSPELVSNYEGDMQQLPGGEDFLGWGAQPYFAEFDAHGRLVFDGRFVGANSSYRAYRFPWNATPSTAPALAAVPSGRRLTVYASWNGATAVAAWRVLGADGPAPLRTLRTTRRQGFETAIRVPWRRYVAVEALDRSGAVLRSSRTIRVR